MSSKLDAFQQFDSIAALKKAVDGYYQIHEQRPRVQVTGNFLGRNSIFLNGQSFFVTDYAKTASGSWYLKVYHEGKIIDIRNHGSFTAHFTID